MGRPKVAERTAALADEAESPLLLAFEALADPVRLRMVRLHGKQERCVCQLTERFGLSQASISHHVAILKRAHLVLERRDARWTYYRLSPIAAASVRHWLDEVLDTSLTDPTPASCCDPQSRAR